MIIDAYEIEAGTSVQCDLCIIGAGAAGISLAREFDNTNLNVWLLESGNFDFERATQDMYAGTSIGRSYYPLDQTRLRYLGGTTNHWGGLCRPLDGLDFSKREWIPYSGWPFDRNHLTPWYKRAQTICELDRFDYDAESWLPEEQKPSPFAAGHLQTKVYQHSPPTRFGKTYREQIRASSNITACLHANVTNLETNDPPVHLRQLQVKTLNGIQLNIRPRITVLACGSIENARLLLSSNEIDTKGLGNQHGLVGRFFMDHLILRKSSALLTTSKLLPKFWYRPQHRKRRLMPTPTLILGNEVQEQEKISNYSVTLRPPARPAGLTSYRYIEAQLDRERGIDRFWHHLGNILGDIDDVASMLYYKHTDNENRPVEPVLYQQWEQVPNPDSRVTLSSEKDRLGLPRVKLDWQLSEIDFHTLVAGQQALAREVGRLGIGRLRTDLGKKREMPDNVRGDHHQLGTTRMHESPLQGVVDANCKLHSIDNLFIAGGSVFPTAGSANPTLTIVALALRLADHLKEKLA